MSHNEKAWRDSSRGRCRRKESGRLLYSLTLLAAVCFAGCAPQEMAKPVETVEPLVESVYLLSFFGEDGADLRFAYSDDLYQWTEIPGPHAKPKVGDMMMRDVFVAQGPDGVFHMVWTTGPGRTDIGHSSSPDLVTWSRKTLIPAMLHKKKARNCWAPKLFYDEQEQQWLITWSTWLDDGTFEPPQLPRTNMQNRIFYTTTKDFKQFGRTGLLFDPGYNCVDGCLLKSGAEYLLFFKDARDSNSTTVNPEHQNIRFARGQSPYGPFRWMSAPITGSGDGEWHNAGPSAVKKADEYFVFYEHYSTPLPRYLGAVKSSDLANWLDVTESMGFPEGAQSGNILRTSPNVIERLLSRNESKAVEQ